MTPKTMKLSEYASKLVYQREVNTGYKSGFMGRVVHAPIKSFSTPKNNKFDSGLEGLDLSFDDHVSQKEIIEKAIPDIFNNITLSFNSTEIITDEIKTMFIKRFWNKRLGMPTIAQWQSELEYYFMEECKNALIQNYLLSTINIDDFLDGGSVSGSNNTDSMQGNKNTPDGSTLNITHDQKMLLDRATSVVRAIGQGSSDQNTKIAKYQAFLMAQRTSLIDDVILQNARKLFMLIG